MTLYQVNRLDLGVFDANQGIRHLEDEELAHPPEIAQNARHLALGPIVMDMQPAEPPRT